MKIKTYKYLGLGLVIAGLLLIIALMLSDNLLQTYYSSPMPDGVHRSVTMDQIYAMNEFKLYIILPTIGSLLAGLVILLIYFRKKRIIENHGGTGLNTQ
ncbi:MAG: hypothetical protein AAB038_02535 [Planctomycetota bacterium]